MMHWAILSALVALSVQGPLEFILDDREKWLQVCCEENDGNGDGAISFREFMKFFSGLVDIDRKDIVKTFLKLDQDKNSDIDGSECGPARTAVRLEVRSRAQNFMKKFDRNGDQMLDRTESRNLGSTVFGLGQRDSDKSFDFNDFNNNDLVDLKEAMDMIIDMRQRNMKLTPREAEANDSSLTVEETTRVKRRAAVRVSPSSHLHELPYFPLKNKPTENNREKSFIRRHNYLLGQKVAASSRARRNVQRRDAIPTGETAPPIAYVADDIDEKTLAKLGQKAHGGLAGGGRTPSVDLSVTVPYDDPDFS